MWLSLIGISQYKLNLQYRSRVGVVGWSFLPILDFDELSVTNGPKYILKWQSVQIWTPQSLRYVGEVPCTWFEHWDTGKIYQKTCLNLSQELQSSDVAPHPLLWLVHTARNRDRDRDRERERKKMGFYILCRHVHTAGKGDRDQEGEREQEIW